MTDLFLVRRDSAGKRRSLTEVAMLLFSSPEREAGLTLLELVVASTMLLILATMALPLARVQRS